MVKKKGKSKRTTLKDKYKIQRRTAETHRKRKKEAKKNAASGVVINKPKNKDPGIPNSWPFKQDLLKEIQRTRERQQQLQEEAKEKRKAELRMLREHQAHGGSARTVQEMLEQAQRDQAKFNSNSQDDDTKLRSDGAVAAGQQSRRAYLRELKKVIDTADVLLQVLDARDPVGSRIHPAVEDAILSRSDKKMVLVLNKIDLVPKDVVSAWLTTLRRSHPTIAIKASLDRQQGGADGKAIDDDASTSAATNTPLGMDGLLQLLKNYARTDEGSGGSSKTKTTIVVGIIGYPNVGKSSIINSLKRSRAVGVSPRPGFTTSLQEVVLDRNVRLLDSPGIVFDDRSAMLGNCVDAESIEDPIPAVEALLKRCNHESLLMTYNIPAFPKGDVMIFLAMVAKSHGRVLKGGIPDKVAAARLVLKDWNHGKIPYFTVPPPVHEAGMVVSDAVIVSHFGKEFDVNAFDQEVLSGLKNSDEMDFVRIESTKESSRPVGKVAQKAIDFLSKMEDSEEEDCSEDMDEDSDDDNPSARAALASADDYDFNDL